MEKPHRAKPTRPPDFTATLDHYTDAIVAVWRRRGFRTVQVTEYSQAGPDSWLEDRESPPDDFTTAQLFDLYEGWGRDILSAMRIRQLYGSRVEGVNL